MLSSVPQRSPGFRVFVFVLWVLAREFFKALTPEAHPRRVGWRGRRRLMVRAAGVTCINTDGPGALVELCRCVAPVDHPPFLPMTGPEIKLEVAQGVDCPPIQELSRQFVSNLNLPLISELREQSSEPLKPVLILGVEGLPVLDQPGGLRLCPFKSRRTKPVELLYLLQDAMQG